MKNVIVTLALLIGASAMAQGTPAATPAETKPAIKTEAPVVKAETKKHKKTKKVKKETKTDGTAVAPK